MSNVRFEPTVRRGLQELPPGAGGGRLLQAAQNVTLKFDAAVTLAAVPLASGGYHSDIGAALSAVATQVCCLIRFLPKGLYAYTKH